MPKAKQPWTRSTNPLVEGALQADTVVRRAANILSADRADVLEAIAAVELGYGDMRSSVQQRFQAARAEQAARALHDEQHRQAALKAGNVLGYGLGLGLAVRGGGNGAIYAMGRLGNQGKGRVGEAMSVVRTIAQGDVPVQFQKALALKAGGKTVIDHGTLFGKKVVEAKYRTGRSATLRGQQLKAQKQFGSDYRFDRWGPQDVINRGRAAGAGAAGGLAVDRETKGRR